MCALRLRVLNKKQIMTVVVGAAALAGLTYTVTKRGLQRRANEAFFWGETLANKQAQAEAADARELEETEAAALELSAQRDWERELARPRGSTPEPLDVALNLDGIFDAELDDSELTVRPSDHVRGPLNADDEDPPSPDDLGRAWLSQATEAERSATEDDLIANVDEIAVSAQEIGEADDDELSDEEREERAALA